MFVLKNRLGLIDNKLDPNFLVNIFQNIIKSTHYCDQVIQRTGSSKYFEKTY